MHEVLAGAFYFCRPLQYLKCTMYGMVDNETSGKSPYNYEENTSSDESNFNEGEPGKQHDPLQQSLSFWLSSNGFPPQILQVLNRNGIDTVDLLSHCDNSEITGLCQLMSTELPKIFTYGLRTSPVPFFLPHPCLQRAVHKKQKKRGPSSIQKSYYGTHPITRKPGIPKITSFPAANEPSPTPNSHGQFFGGRKTIRQ